MHVALFGGSFNPPHVAHQMAAFYVLQTQPVDQLWLVPCFKHPFEKSLETFENRKAMCELAAAPLGPRVHVSDIERRLAGDSLTLRTVKALQTENPGCRFSWIIGADLVPEIDSWFGAAELRLLVSFLVVGRAGHAGATADGVQLPRVSSSDVRARLASGLPVSDRIPQTVLTYIQDHDLYGHKRDAP